MRKGRLTLVAVISTVHGEVTRGRLPPLSTSKSRPHSSGRRTRGDVSLPGRLGQGRTVGVVSPPLSSGGEWCTPSRTSTPPITPQVLNLRLLY